MNKCLSPLLAAALLGLPALSLAHTGHGGHGFLDGFTHPFAGMDHLLAMLVVGVWSVLHTRRVWLAPLCFVSFLAIGAILGQHGIIVAQLEPLVAASVLVLGAMLTLPFKLADSLSLAVIGAFALCHGMAHGGELSAGSSVLPGIVLGSALLHAAGMSFAHFFLQQRPLLARRLGRLIAVLGGGLLLSSVI
jgi:urease accessory protein